MFEWVLNVPPVIQYECWKIRTRKTPNTSTFHAVFLAIKKAIINYFWFLIEVRKYFEKIRKKTPSKNTMIQITFSWRRPVSSRNQSIDLLCKSMNWFLYDRDPHYERVKRFFVKILSFSNFPQLILRKICQNSGFR